VPDTQVSDETREQSFSGTHRLERKVRNIMPDAAHEQSYLASQECGEIDTLQDEFDMCNVPVKAIALRGEQSLSSTLLEVGQYEETAEEREREEDEDKRYHGNQRTERRAKRLTSTRSPNFCVASSRRVCTVLSSSLMKGCSRSTWSRK